LGEGGVLKVSVLDDFFDTLRTLACFEKLAEHDVTVWVDLDSSASNPGPHAWPTRSECFPAHRSAIQRASPWSE
jgi:hypothetical protein